MREVLMYEACKVKKQSTGTDVDGIFVRLLLHLLASFPVKLKK
jgi:hypothetical protein